MDDYKFPEPTEEDIEEFNRLSAGPAKSKEYSNEYKSVIRYLEKMPWAMTVKEIVRSGRKTFLKRRFKKTRGRNKEKRVIWKIRTFVIHPGIVDGALQENRASHAGKTWFKIMPHTSSHAPRTSVQEVTFISIKRDEQKKIAIRMLLEFWNMLISRNIKSEKVSDPFKILYYLGKAGEDGLSSTQLAKLLGEEKLTGTKKAIENWKMLKEYKGRLAFLKIVRKGRGGGIPTIYALSDGFREIWDNAMKPETLRWWSRWEKQFREERIRWQMAKGR